MAAGAALARAQTGSSGASAGWVHAPSGRSEVAVASLGEQAAVHGRLYGSAVDAGMLRNDPVYRSKLVEQCRVVVAESAMKWGPLRPTPDTYHWEDADALLAFAEEHRMKVRGHNLCWHEQLPRWFEATATEANAAEILKTHIRTVAGRYRGRIRAWDVVNEAIQPHDGKPDGFRDSPWFRLLGSSYVETAFRTAKEADPAALLTYNEYDIEYDNPPQVAKRAAVLALLKRLQAAGVPLDAVGVQAHLTADAPHALGPGLLAFVDELHGMGLQVFITEMDVNDDHVASDDPAVRDAAVAAVYGKYVGSMVAHPAVADVLTWGISDNHSWLNNSKEHKAKHPDRQERALPLDTAYAPKPAFYALRNALSAGTPPSRS